MNENMIEGLKGYFCSIASLLEQAEQINALQERFHSGETVTLSLKIGEDTVSQNVLIGNVRGACVDEFFKTWNERNSFAIKNLLNDCMDFFEKGENR